MCPSVPGWPYLPFWINRGTEIGRCAGLSEIPDQIFRIRNRAAERAVSINGDPQFSPEGIEMDIGEQSTARTREWVNDNCGSGFIWPLSRQRAEGIARIHATCDPPCPRLLAAIEYLNTLGPSAIGSGDGAGDGGEGG
ncbi:hypothetical protein [Nocardia sp. JMUB6875]|uniref:hypothetical protein n=1 Tax=Nocardia sp. JMUB6875 TaxID=3158170 RepID=UPI0034E8E178